MFSPRVKLPLTVCSVIPRWRRPVGTRPSYWTTSLSVSAVKASRSSSVHQEFRFPSPSYFDPWSSKPWPISWPITAPMAPKLPAMSAAGSKNGGRRIAAGKVMSFFTGL